MYVHVQYVHVFLVIRFELLIPKKWRSNDSKPVYIHMAGTGDHVSMM